MHIRHLFVILIVSHFFTLAHGMQNTTQDSTDYNLLRIHDLAPKDVWLQIIARADKKYIIQQTCSCFRDYASTRNDDIFLQNPLIIVPEVLERFALYYADFTNNTILSNLLYHGANPNSADDNGKSLMHYAVQNGNLDMVKTLLEHHAFDKTNMATTHQSPLFLAAQCKHMQIVKHILSECTTDYNAMLCFAIQYELSDFIKLLLPHISYDSTLNYTEIISPDRNYKRRKLSILHHAAIKGDVDTAQMLISKGISVDLPDLNNCPPFHYAISSNATDMTHLFMNNKANIHTICNDEGTALHHAINAGLMTKALFLLKNGVDINIKDNHGGTALYRAIVKGHMHVAKLLLAYNADANERDNDGITALHRAYLNNQTEMVKLLLTLPDIDTTLHINTKQTLLFFILDHNYNNYKDVIDLIIKKTDINALDVHGNSPLSYAFWRDNTLILQKLLEQPTININILCGKNLSNKFRENTNDHFGYKRTGPVTVLDLVLRHGKTETIDLLRKYGAKTKAELEEEGLIEKI